MGLFNNFLRIFGGNSAGAQVETRSTLSNPEQWFIDWATGGAGNNSAGVAVTENTALTVSAVYACCALRAKTIASLHLGLYETLGNGDVREVTDAPEYYTICDEPSDLYSSYTWRSTSEYHQSLLGNSYSKISFDKNGRVRRLTLIDPQHVTPFFYNDRLWYDVTHNHTGRRETLAASEVLHIKNMSSDGLVGKSQLTVARQTIGQAIAAEKLAATLYKNGGLIKGVLEHPGKLKADQIAELRGSIRSIIQDYENTSGIAVLQDGMKFSPISMTPKDAEWIASHSLSVRDIARFYGIPPHMIGDLERATFSNIEQQSIEFVQHVVRPQVKNWEAELNRRILRPSDRGRFFFRFNLDSLLRGDTAARATFYTQMFQIGALSPDDIRRSENLNAIPDGLGGDYYRPMNMIELGAEPTPDPTTDPATPQTDTNDDTGTPQAAK